MCTFIRDLLLLSFFFGQSIGVSRDNMTKSIQWATMIREWTTYICLFSVAYFEIENIYM